MSDDPDFPKANHALLVLRQARLSRNDATAIMLGDLVYEMAGAGCGPLKKLIRLHGLRFPPWQKVSKKKALSPPALWKAALGAAESSHPIQLHVDLSVDPAKEKELLHNFETIFRPAS